MTLRIHDTSRDGELSTPYGLASARDQAYFKAHPGCVRYVRRRIIGEFGRDIADDLRKDAYTEVEQFAPGIRTRLGIHMLRGRDYPTGEIPFEHIEAYIAQVAERGGVWRRIPREEVDDGDGGGAA